MTPEGKVKDEVKKILKHYGRRVWWNMPVPVGFGVPMLDFIGCANGFFFAIETKKAKITRGTERQEQTAEHMRDAGGRTILINAGNLHELAPFIDTLLATHKG